MSWELVVAQDGEGLNGGYIPHLQGMKTSKCGHSGSCRKAPGWGELEIAVAGEHTGPLTSSPVTEAWWGHSGLGHDSAGIALRSLHWPEWECCSQGVGVAGWGCFLVLGTHLQKSQVFLVPGKFA